MFNCFRMESPNGTIENKLQLSDEARLRLEKQVLSEILDGNQCADMISFVIGLDINEIYRVIDKLVDLKVIEPAPGEENETPDLVKYQLYGGEQNDPRSPVGKIAGCVTRIRDYFRNNYGLRPSFGFKE